MTEQEYRDSMVKLSDFCESLRGKNLSNDNILLIESAIRSIQTALIFETEE
ncbi:hypothetical protein [Erwinia phage FBB1]|nr:hypothetical protein [Erwinia phage FBB1]